MNKQFKITMDQGTRQTMNLFTKVLVERAEERIAMLQSREQTPAVKKALAETQRELARLLK